MPRPFASLVVLLFAALVVSRSSPASAQGSDGENVFQTEQIEQLVAPSALDTDSLGGLSAGGKTP